MPKSALAHQDIWNQPVSDFRPRRLQTVQERREHIAAVAAVKGKRWFANRFLDFQAFPSPHIASAELIRRSRTLIKEARPRIANTRSILAFARRGERVN